VPLEPPARFVAVPTLTALNAVCPVPPLATGKVPVTPLVNDVAAKLNVPLPFVCKV
jgi:hypothetical protein